MPSFLLHGRLSGPSFSNFFTSNRTKPEYNQTQPEFKPEYNPNDRGKNATCSNIFYYPGFYHHDQDGYTNEEPGMPLGYDSFCMDMGTGDILEDVTINNFATQENWNIRTCLVN